jgi:hypothetical protein
MSRSCGKLAASFPKERNPFEEVSVHNPVSFLLLNEPHRLSLHSILPLKHISIIIQTPSDPQSETNNTTQPTQYRLGCRTSTRTALTYLQDRRPHHRYYISPNPARPGTLGTSQAESTQITPVTQWLSVSFLYLFYGTNMIHYPCFIGVMRKSRVRIPPGMSFYGLSLDKFIVLTSY